MTREEALRRARVLVDSWKDIVLRFEFPGYDPADVESFITSGVATAILEGVRDATAAQVHAVPRRTLDPNSVVMTVYPEE